MAIQAIGNIFANGAASYISRRLGAKDYEEAKRTSSVAVYTGIAIGAVITIRYFRVLQERHGLQSLETEPEHFTSFHILPERKASYLFHREALNQAAKYTVKISGLEYLLIFQIW